MILTKTKAKIRIYGIKIQILRIFRKNKILNYYMANLGNSKTPFSDVTFIDMH